MTRPVVGYAADFASGHHIRRHRHAAGQLIFAASGVMTVTTDAGRWVVPPERAVWVPPHVPHAIRMTGMVRMRTLYLEAKALERIAGLPAACAVVQVRPLLRELILQAVACRQPYAPSGREARLVAVLLDELTTARAAPLHLPMPRDPRLLAITERLSLDPADKRPSAPGRGPLVPAPVRSPVSSGARPVSASPTGASKRALARARAPRRRRSGDQRRARPRLRQPECLHHDVPLAARRHARTLFLPAAEVPRADDERSDGAPREVIRGAFDGLVRFALARPNVRGPAAREVNSRGVRFRPCALRR
jgi:hypothetical protein